MTSAYGPSEALNQSDQSHVRESLSYIPLKSEVLKDGTKVVVDFLQSPQDIDAGMLLLNTVIEEGLAWPFETILNRQEFCNYFMSHCALVVRKKGTAEVLGAFYVKPNFPGRSSHFANGGFITAPHYRGNGVGTLMGSIFKRVAKDLGFRAALFNLVYKSNTASVALWKKLNFVSIGTLSGVGRLKNLGFVDADIYYFDLESSGNPDAYNRNEFINDFFKVIGIFLIGVVVGRFGRSKS